MTTKGPSARIFPLVLKLALFLCIVQAKSILQPSQLFHLSVIHFNDFHARFDETNDDGGACKIPGECIGGFSRLYTEIKKMRDENSDSILLNAGDTFQGTLWYEIGKWNVTQQFMRKLNIDAEVLGNHDFDDGIKGVVPYIKSLNYPVIVSNIDDRLEPEIQGTYKKSIVIERNGRKIGIIGVTTVTCKELSNTGNLEFFDESSSVNREAERLVEEEGVFTNIVLSHSGYDVDQKIAANASDKISLIVGGHSHTFLYTGDNPPGPAVVRGPYPTIVQSRRGHKVLVVQASAYCRYLGNVTVLLGDDGEVVDFSGEPLFLSNDLPQDGKVNEELLPWKERVDAMGNRVVGSSLVELKSKDCYAKECTLGNFIADTTIYAFSNSSTPESWSNVALAVVNPGGLRSSMGPGNITYSDLLISQPFQNTLDMGELQGKYIKEIFEHSSSNNEGYMQVSGFRVVFDASKPEGERVVSLKVRCQRCIVPTYEDLDLERTYRIAMCSYLSNGGSGFTMISDNLKNKIVGGVDVDVIMEYFAHRSPVFQEVEGRITILNNQTR